MSETEEQKKQQDNDIFKIFNRVNKFLYELSKFCRTMRSTDLYFYNKDPVIVRSDKESYQYIDSSFTEKRLDFSSQDILEEKYCRVPVLEQEVREFMLEILDSNNLDEFYLVVSTTKKAIKEKRIWNFIKESGIQEYFYKGCWSLSRCVYLGTKEDSPEINKKTVLVYCFRIIEEYKINYRAAVKEYTTKHIVAVCKATQNIIDRQLAQKINTERERIFSPDSLRERGLVFKGLACIHDPRRIQVKMKDLENDLIRLHESIMSLKNAHRGANECINLMNKYICLALEGENSQNRHFMDICYWCMNLVSLLDKLEIRDSYILKDAIRVLLETFITCHSNSLNCIPRRLVAEKWAIDNSLIKGKRASMICQELNKIV